jgi:hypothetical protein
MKGSLANDGRVKIGRDTGAGCDTRFHHSYSITNTQLESCHRLPRGATGIRFVS